MTERAAVDPRRYVAEGLGTFVLVALGPGAAVVDRGVGHGALGPIGVALAFFFALLAGISAWAPRSGAHFNPAVTVGLWSAGRFETRAVVPYVVSQCAGATLAALLLRVVGGAAIAAAATVPAVPTAAAFGVELVFSAILMVVILGVATDPRVPVVLAALAVAGAVGGMALLGALTGSSMNPARSFGPAVASGVWRAHWLYWLAPIAGMVAAARAHRALGATDGRGAPQVPPGVPLGVEGPLGPGDPTGA